MPSGWWSEMDDEILGCLGEASTLTPSEIGGRLGLSSDAVTSALCLLAQEGKVRICLVSAHQVAGAAVKTAA